MIAPADAPNSAGVPWFKWDDVRPSGALSLGRNFCTSWAGVDLGQCYETRELQYLSGTPTTQYRSDVRGYVMATVLVTGEQRTALSRAIEPLMPFDPVELFGPRLSVGCTFPGVTQRYAQRIRPTFDSDRSANPHRVDGWLQRYLNKFVRFQFNWEYARFANPVRLGEKAPKGNLDHQNSFLGRFQVTF